MEDPPMNNASLVPDDNSSVLSSKSSSNHSLQQVVRVGLNSSFHRAMNPSLSTSAHSSLNNEQIHSPNNEPCRESSHVSAPVIASGRSRNSSKTSLNHSSQQVPSGNHEPCPAPLHEQSHSSNHERERPLSHETNPFSFHLIKRSPPTVHELIQIFDREPGIRKRNSFNQEPDQSRSRRSSISSYPHVMNSELNHSALSSANHELSHSSNRGAGHIPSFLSAPVIASGQSQLSSKTSFKQSSRQRRHSYNHASVARSNSVQHDHNQVPTRYSLPPLSDFNAAFQHDSSQVSPTNYDPNRAALYSNADFTHHEISHPFSPPRSYHLSFNDSNQPSPPNHATKLAKNLVPKSDFPISVSRSNDLPNDIATSSSSSTYTPEQNLDCEPRSDLNTKPLLFNSIPPSELNSESAFDPFSGSNRNITSNSTTSTKSNSTTSESSSPVPAFDSFQRVRNSASHPNPNSSGPVPSSESHPLAVPESDSGSCADAAFRECDPPSYDFVPPRNPISNRHPPRLPQYVSPLAPVDEIYSNISPLAPVNVINSNISPLAPVNVGNSSISRPAPVNNANISSPASNDAQRNVLCPLCPEPYRCFCHLWDCLERCLGVKCRLILVLTLFFCLILFWKYFFIYLAKVVPVFEIVYKDAVDVGKSRPAPELDNERIFRLRQALMIPTISYLVDDGSPNKLREFAHFLKTNFPLIHDSPLISLKVVEKYTLLYEFRGSDTNLQAYLLCAHQDVHTIGDRREWIFDPFSAKVKDNYVYARGAFSKSQLMAIMEVLENRLATHWRPVRTLYIALNYNEEVYGRKGASGLARYLEGKNKRFLFVLDAGSAIEEFELPNKPNLTVAMVSVGEQLRMYLEITAHGRFDLPVSEQEKRVRKVLHEAETRLLNQDSPIATLGSVEERAVQLLLPHHSPMERILYACHWFFGSRSIRGIGAFNLDHTRSLIRTSSGSIEIKIKNESHGMIVYGTLFLIRVLYPTLTASQMMIKDKTLLSDLSIAYQCSYPKNLKFEPPSAIAPFEGEGYSLFGWHSVKNAIRRTFNGSIVVPYTLKTKYGTGARYFQGISESVLRFLPVKVDKSELDRRESANERISLEIYQTMMNFYSRLMDNAELSYLVRV